MSGGKWNGDSNIVRLDLTKPELFMNCVYLISGHLLLILKYFFFNISISWSEWERSRKLLLLSYFFLKISFLSRWLLTSICRASAKPLSANLLCWICGISEHTHLTSLRRCKHNTSSILSLHISYHSSCRIHNFQCSLRSISFCTKIIEGI